MFFFGLVVALQLLLWWGAAQIVPFIKLVQNFPTIALILTIFGIAIGMLWGLGHGYGERPSDMRGIRYIWITAAMLGISTAFGLWLVWPAPEDGLAVKSMTDILIVVAMWLCWVSLLGCISLSVRRETINKAAAMQSSPDD